MYRSKIHELTAAAAAESVDPPYPAQHYPIHTNRLDSKRENFAVQSSAGSVDGDQNSGSIQRLAWISYQEGRKPVGT
jgi:hypothetical protein